MAMVGRNSACPCGSGKRYKDCHGAPAASPGIDSRKTPQLMKAALDAQRRGSLKDAQRLYEEVLISEPANFDAIHMLGVVQYARGRFDEAAALLGRAIALRPDVAAARQNLRLLESIPRMEREVCAAALTRARNLVDPIVDLASRAARMKTVNILIAGPLQDDGRQAIADLAAVCSGARVEIWAAPGVVTGQTKIREMGVGADRPPRTGMLVLVGTEYSAVAWLDRTTPLPSMLLVLRDDPCAQLERMRELSHEGNQPVWLAYTSHELMHRIGLPGVIVETVAAAVT
jgi:hypothetical protein